MALVKGWALALGALAAPWAAWRRPWFLAMSATLSLSLVLFMGWLALFFHIFR